MAELIMSRVDRKGIPNIYCALYEDDSFLATPAANNTIAIISNSGLPLGNVYFQEDFPENPNNGDIFIQYKDGKLVDFSSYILNLTLSVQGVIQYIDGSWDYKIAYICYNGEWIQVSKPRLYIYNRGTQNTALTGSWTKKADGNGAATWGTESLALTTSSTSARYVSVYTSKKIDVTSFKKMVVILGNLTGDPNASGSTLIGLVTSPYTGVKGSELRANFITYKGASTSAGATQPGEFTYEIPFDDNIVGSYYIQIGTYTMRESYYYEIYLE